MVQGAPNKTVYVIKDTVDIYYFCKNCDETAQEHLLFKLPSVSFNREVPAFFFQNWKISPIPNRNPPPPGAKKIGRKPDPQAVGKCESPGDGKAWN